MARYFYNVAAAKADYLARHPDITLKLSENGASLAVASLPDEYDATPYCTVVNGKFTDTVGDYKAEVAKHESYF